MADEILFENKFLAIINRDGYTFVREVRADGMIVSVVPFRDHDGNRNYLARLEICPAHGDDLERCSITGGMEKGDTPDRRAAEETWEEAGFRVREEALMPLGIVRPTKSSDTTVYLFAVNVTDMQQAVAKGDGTKWEIGASSEWLSYADAATVQDPLFATAILRLNVQYPPP